MRLRSSVVFALRSLFKDQVYTVRHGLAKGLRRKGGLGFVPQITPLVAEERFILSLDLQGQVVYDLGGLEGVFTLFFARRVGPLGCVVTFEPNPVNYEIILENVRLNRLENVTVLPIGLGSERERVPLVFPVMEMGRGSAEPAIQQQIMREPGVATLEIAIDSLDHQIAARRLPWPDLVKIDVEGMEFDVLVGMETAIRRCKPRLYIEVHGADMQKKTENITRIADFLLRRDYTLYHVESQNEIGAANAADAREGHLYCY